MDGASGTIYPEAHLAYLDYPISLKEFRTLLPRLCSGSCYVGLPPLRRSRLMVLKSASLCCKPEKKYSRQELESVISSWTSDIAGGLISVRFADLLPLLIEEGLLAWSPDGSRYWRHADRSGRLFAPEIDDLSQLDMKKLVIAARKQPPPTTTLGMRLVQRLPGPDSVLIEWEGDLKACGAPEDCADQFRAGSWHLMAAALLELLPEFIERVTQAPVSYMIEWADSIIFMSREDRVMASIDEATYGWGPRLIPVFVLVSHPDHRDAETRPEEGAARALACLVPGFYIGKSRGAPEGGEPRLRATISRRVGPETRVFAFRALSPETTEAILAAAEACQVEVEPLGPLVEDWEPELFKKLR